MGTDRYITWGETPEWGEPTPEKLAAVARDFLGEGWRTTIRDDYKGSTVCVVVDSDFKSTFHLASERPECGDPYAYPDGHATRGFEIWFDDHAPGRTRVTTRAHYCDSFTSALVRRYTEIIAKWWNGEVKWPS